MDNQNLYLKVTTIDEVIRVQQLGDPSFLVISLGLPKGKA